MKPRRIGFRKPAETRILCFGEILFDMYPDRKKLGGAPFNFAWHLHHFGHRVGFVSRIGQDALGQEILQHLQQHRFPTDLLQIDPEWPTGTVHVTLDARGVPDFTIVERVAWDRIAFDAAVQQFLRDGVDLIYFGSLAQRHATSRQTLQRLLQAVPAGTLVFCDLNLRQKFYNREILQQAVARSQVVKLNEAEFAVVQQELGFRSPEAQAATALVQAYGLRLLCITRGERGSTLFLPHGRVDWPTCDALSKCVARDDPQNGETLDTVGAGDGYAAVLAHGLLAGWAPETLLDRASCFAAALCQIPGAVPEDKEFYTKNWP